MSTAQSPCWLAVSLVYGLALVYMLVFYILPAQGPFFLQALGARPGLTGLILGGFTLMAALTSLAYARLIGRFEARRIAALGMLLLGGGWLLVSMSQSLLATLPGLLIAGSGAGLVFPNLYTWLADLTPPAWRGRVTAGMSSAVFLGQFLRPLILSAPAGHPARGFVWGARVMLVIGLALLIASVSRSRRSVS